MATTNNNPTTENDMTTLDEIRSFLADDFKPAFLDNRVPRDRAYIAHKMGRPMEINEIRDTLFGATAEELAAAGIEKVRVDNSWTGFRAI
jgi:hypothetical protein